MQRRRSVEVQGVTHGATPIPLGAQVGRLVFSSGISGVDPESGKIPPDASRQVELVFHHVYRFMEVVGGSTEDIGRMTVYLEDEKYRDLVNREWTKMFPDPANRPARHSTVAHLRGGALVQVEITAVLQS